MSRLVLTLEDRFWAKVDRRGEGECWPWTGATQQPGYGRIRTGEGRGLETSHRLFLGAARENVADMVAKRRHRPQGRVPINIGERERRRLAGRPSAQ